MMIFNKKYLIVLTILFQAYLCGMQKPITRPYSPPFLMKHKRLLTNSVSLTAGFLAGFSALSHYKKTDCTNTKSYFLASSIGISAAALTKLAINRINNRLIKPTLLDLMILNPTQALKHIYAVHDQFIKKAKSENLDEVNENNFEKSLKLVEEFEEKCPLFLLGECTQEGFGPCILSRTYKPKYREAFEKKISQTLIDKLNSDTSTIYTSFGSGGSFQDVVILAKTLVRNPNASIDLHLIDPKYSFYSFSRDNLNWSHIINDSAFDLEQSSEQTLPDYKKENDDDKRSDEEIKTYIKMRYIFDELPCKQMNKWIQQVFPNATLNISLYHSAPVYIQQREQNQSEFPDVISACDIEDEMSLLNHSIEHYLQLCNKTLQAKPSSANVLLKKYPAALDEIAFEPKKNYQRVEDEEQSYYVKSTSL